MTTPAHDDSQAAVRRSFAAQRVMAAFGATLAAVAPGRVEIAMPFRDDLTQQHGFLHAGVTTTLLDSACGYAALSLMPASAEVLSIEFKVNLLSPAVGERFVARGEVRRAGRSVTVCQGELFAFQSAGEKLVALMQATMMTVTR